MSAFIDNNLVVFESSPDFSDNPRGLYEYIKKNTDLDTAWVVHNSENLQSLIKLGVKAELFESDEGRKLIGSAKYLVSSSFEMAYGKKAGQIHISAWHGFPLKLVGFFESAEGIGANFDIVKVITTQTDLIISTSRLSQIMLSGLWAVDPRKVKVTGYPRNDLMLEADGWECMRRVVPGISTESKLLFYLPTMRKGLKDEGEQFSSNVFNYTDYDVDALDVFLEQHNAYIVMKLHFADAIHFNEGAFALPKRSVVLTDAELIEKGLTIYHLMKAFSVLITDYSSVYADYLLLNRPVVFSCPDIERYCSDRGFTADNPADFMPGPIIGTQNELMEKLGEILDGKDGFKEDRSRANSLINKYRDDCSGKRVYEDMLSLASGSGAAIDSAKRMGNLFTGTDAPLSQYMDSLEAKFYFDSGEGYSESDSLIFPYDIDGLASLEFRVEIPRGTENVRFDPDDFARIALRNLEITIDGAAADFLVPGAALSDGLYVYEDSDPKIIIPVPNDASHELVVRFEGIDLLNRSNSLLVELINQVQHDRIGFLDHIENLKSDFQQQLDDIENSTSWKVTKPLRAISSVVKRGK